MTATTHKEFVSNCKSQNQRTFLTIKNDSGFPCLIQYCRDKQWRPIGVVVIYKYQGRLHIGWSLCRKDDRWNKHVGVYKAISRAEIITDESPGWSPQVPTSVRSTAQLLFNRATRILKKETGPSQKQIESTPTFNQDCVTTQEDVKFYSPSKRTTIVGLCNRLTSKFERKK